MARKDQVRHQLFLPRKLSDRLGEVARQGGASRSAILSQSLERYLEHKGSSELETVFAVRLDRMSRQLARIERGGHIGIESLALFIRYMLTVNAPLADEDDAARAIGRDRFAAFTARVGQQLASGRRSFETDESK